MNFRNQMNVRMPPKLSLYLPTILSEPIFLSSDIHTSYFFSVYLLTTLTRGRDDCINGLYSRININIQLLNVEYNKIMKHLHYDEEMLLTSNFIAFICLPFTVLTSNMDGSVGTILQK